MTVSSVFALIAAFLAVVGLYGVVAFDVSQRTHEIGVRLALGATRGIVLRLVLRQVLVLAVLGVAAGLFGSAALTRLLTSALWGVTPTDPLTFASVAALMIAAAVAAGLLPTHRATRVNPLVALREE